MSENKIDYGRHDLVRIFHEMSEAWKGIVSLPKYLPYSMKREQILGRFYNALRRLHELDPLRAVGYANAYNRWVSHLPNACECMYFRSLG